MIGETYLRDSLGMTLVGHLAAVNTIGVALVVPTPIGLQVMRGEELRKRGEWSIVIQLDADHQELEGTITRVVFTSHGAGP